MKRRTLLRTSAVALAGAALGLLTVPGRGIKGRLRGVWDCYVPTAIKLQLRESGPALERAEAREVGLSAEALESLSDGLGGRGTLAFLVVRDGRLVHERYARCHGPSVRHYTASAAKALVGGMGLVLAVREGLVDLDQPASRFIPSWESDVDKARITVRQLATHTSGLADAEENGRYTADLPGWKGRYWADRGGRYRIAIDEVPVVFEPGTAYGYSNPGYSALSYVLGAAFGSTSRPDLRERLAEVLMGPLGLDEEDWQIGDGLVFAVDGLRLYDIGGGANFTARSLATVGQLMLDNGVAGGMRLLDPAEVQALTRPASRVAPNRVHGSPAPGLGWHTNANSVFPSLPADAFMAVGAEHQVLLVIPSLALVVVRNGAPLGDAKWGPEFWATLERELFGPLAELFP